MSGELSENVFLRGAPRALAPWVEEFWYSRGALDVSRERVLPSATTDIVANLGHPMRLVVGNGDARITGTTVTGLLTRPIVLEHPAIHEAVGLRLTVHGIRGILGIPAAAVRDLVVQLPDVVGSAIDELAETCRRASTPQARLDAAVEWAGARIAAYGTSSDPLVRWATQRLEETYGRLSIADLQRESGYGATQFNARFRDEVGVSPKKYARLVRFRNALDRIAPRTEMAALAVDLGYVDQAHMHRDFRTLGDTTPAKVLAARYPSGITMAED